MIHESPPTQADLHFRVAGFPVRVHPFFWVAGLLLGLNGGDADPLDVLLWIAVLFVSILVHELGHAFLQRRFGGHPRIVLHGFGGLAICGDCDRSPRSQILISFAGPAAGFLLAAIILVFLFVRSDDFLFVPAWRSIEDYKEFLSPNYSIRPTGMLIGTLWYDTFPNEAVGRVVSMLLRINILWGLVNLLPVYPLDGGQIARELLTLGPNHQHGLELSMKISMGTAIAMAVFGLIVWNSFFVALLFGLLAYSNFQQWQAYTGRGPGMGWQ